MKDQSRALFQEALKLHQQGNPQKAFHLYRELLRDHPNHSEALHMMAVIQQGEGRLREASECINKAIKINGEKAEFHYTKGNVAGLIGDHHDAIMCYEKAISLKKTHAESYAMLAKSHIAVGQLEEALKNATEAKNLQPDNPKIHFLIGNIHSMMHHTSEATFYFRKTILLDNKFVEAYYNLGTNQKLNGQYRDAIRSFQSALQIDDQHANALVNLGTSLMMIGKFNDAEICMKRAINIKPDVPEYHYNLGMVYDSQDDLVNATLSYTKAIEIDPVFVSAYLNLGSINLKLGRIKEAVLCFEHIHRIDPEHAGASSNRLLCMNYLYADDAEKVFQAHRSWWAAHGRPLQEREEPLRVVKDGQGPVRLAYVSPDFKTHSVAFFAEALLRHHDPSKFEVVCYSDVKKPDATTERLQSYGVRWVDVHEQSDEALADQIRSDRIDILVDLAGHTAHNRMPVFARRAASVQVTYLGYPNTTGLDTMDYRITDRISDPPGLTDLFFTESLVRLPGGFLCYTPPMDAPAVSPPPHVETGVITFGSFNNRSKVTEEVLDVWCAILKAIPGARIMLKFKALESELVQGPLREAFADRGVDPDRVWFHGAVPGTREHLELYRLVDIALDPFPYNGTTTTLEALYMGVPVITKAGRVHVSRVGASILSRIGLQELVADSSGAYIEKAAELAEAPEGLSRWRASLRERLRQSSLMDGEGLTRNLEHAFQGMLTARNAAGSHCGNMKTHQDRKDVSEWIQRGETAFERGDLSEAENCFVRVLEKDPDHSEALNNLGVLSWKHHRIRDAEAYFVRALQTDPDHEDSRQNLKAVSGTA